MTFETIVAQLTPKGIGGIGVVRVSGPKVKEITKSILKREIKPRYAYFSSFYDQEKIIDEGLAIYFKAPNSFTGEDVLELHGHGGSVVLDMLLDCVLKNGARMAEPGEFSKRAFLNNKIDILQAEAIGDIISAQSKQAVQASLLSLQGKFSQRINEIVDLIIELRVQVEASIDFTEEDIDLISKEEVKNRIKILLDKLSKIQNEAEDGRLLHDGVKVVIAGKPNVGKSSLLNYLTGYESAIVTEIPGTTRDVLRENINIAGMPLHIIDTAGLRKSSDLIEQEGIKRAFYEMEVADLIILVTDTYEIDLEEYQKFLNKIIIVRNKIDLISKKDQIDKYKGKSVINISLKLEQGLDLLKDHLLKKAGFSATLEGVFIARKRHLVALKKAQESLLKEGGSFDLLAENLRRAQTFLDEITGKFYTEDLLGQIFSKLCIGK